MNISINILLWQIKLVYLLSETYIIIAGTAGADSSENNTAGADSSEHLSANTQISSEAHIRDW